MASISFSESLTSGNIFVGRAAFGAVLYGSSPEVDLGGIDLNVEIQLRLLGEPVEVRVHRHYGAIKRYWIPDGYELEMTLLERTPETIAKIFGKDSTDITDNSGNTPTDKTIAYGDLSNVEMSEWRGLLQIPQSHVASPLYDFFECLKMNFDPTATEMSFGQKLLQGIPIKVMGLTDPADATYPGAAAVWRHEYS